MNKKKTKKNIILSLGVALGGLSGAAIASYVKIYDGIFPRYERPNYKLIPGLVCYDRLKKPIDRKEISFLSNDNLLKGYYYFTKRPKGIVLIAHGIRSGADDYLNIIKYMIENRYNVFSFNYTGTFESEGDSTVGMCQSLVDVDNAIEYIQSNAEFNRLPLFLLGHSWGGYAVSSVLSLKKNIKACACISSIKNGYTMPLEKAEQYTGKLSATAKPFLNTYQKMLFGDYTNYDGVMGINNSNIPVLIAHGVNDKAVTFEKQSLVSSKKEITNKRVVYYIGKGLQDEHVSILYSIKAIAYQKIVESEIKLLSIQKGRELNDKEKEDFYKTIDHELYSEVNEELFSSIVLLFDSLK